jgi:nucleoside 2-deoxyribosyltransferase
MKGHLLPSLGFAMLRQVMPQVRKTRSEQFRSAAGGLATIVLLLVSLPLRAESANPPANARAYLAGPLGFSEVGRKYKDSILIPALEKAGLIVVDPWKLPDPKRIEKAMSLPLNERVPAWRELNSDIGRNNADAIASCDLVVAVLDGTDVDSGTAAEVGYAFAKGKRIVGYRGDFRLSADNEGAVVNLQVEYFIRASGGDIFRNLDSLVRAVSEFKQTPDRVRSDLTVNEVRSQQAEGIRATQDVVLFFQRAFTVVLALALAEAFKQFVADKAEKEADRVLHWNRLLALVSFLVLIFPFYQGMSRYFYMTYIGATALPQPYGAHLLFDSGVFTAEAALLFIMSRALALAQWRRFYWTAVALSVLDGAWGWTSYLLNHNAPIYWLIIDFAFATAITIMILAFRRQETQNLNNKTKWSYLAAALGLILVCARTGIDYWWGWSSFYFPT